MREWPRPRSLVLATLADQRFIASSRLTSSQSYCVDSRATDRSVSMPGKCWCWKYSGRGRSNLWWQSIAGKLDPLHPLFSASWRSRFFFQKIDANLCSRIPLRSLRCLVNCTGAPRGPTVPFTTPNTVFQLLFDDPTAIEAWQKTP